jgi:hypothetical protein
MIFHKKTTKIIDIANAVLDEKHNTLCKLCKGAGVKCKSKIFCLPSEIIISLIFENEGERTESLKNMEENFSFKGDI